jgi:hypothetical protein
LGFTGVRGRRLHDNGIAIEQKIPLVDEKLRPMTQMSDAFMTSGSSLIAIVHMLYEEDAKKTKRLST